MRLYNLIKKPAAVLPAILFCAMHPQALASAPQNDGAAQVADTAVKELPEIEITADKEIYRKDHVVLRLSDENRKFGTNALDAISTLSRFTTTLNASSLMSYDRRNVYILINGVPSSGDILRTYRADDIKNVEYYDVAPARYRAYTQGPLLNVVTRRRHDMMMSALVSTSNNVNTAIGNNRITLTYADSLNQVKADYGISYSDYGRIAEHTRYDYGDGSATMQTVPDGQNAGLAQNVSLSYQRSQGKHVFDARAKYRWAHETKDLPGTVDVAEQGMLYDGSISEWSRNSSGTFSADLYYSYRHSDRKSLAVNIGNACARGDLDQTLGRTMPGQWSWLDYDVASQTHNTTYNFSGDVSGTYPVGNVDLNGVFRYTHGNLRQRTMEGRYHSSTDKEQLSVGATWMKGLFMIMPNVGTEIYTLSTEAGRNTSVAPTATLFMMMRGSGRLTGASASLTLNTAQFPVAASMTTPGYIYIDRNFISRGNPALKAYNLYNSELKLQYFNPNGRNFISLSGQFIYNDNPIAQVLFREGDMMVRESRNLGHDLGAVAQLTGRWMPASWIYIQPHITYTGSFYDTPSANRRYNDLSYGGTVTAAPGKFAISLSAASPSKARNGDFTTYTGTSVGATFMWQHAGWSLGASWWWMDKNYTEGSCRDFSYRNTVRTKAYQNYVSVNITYFFSKGRYFRHAPKTIGDIKGDAALPTL